MAFPQQTPPPNSGITIERHFTPRDRDTGRYQYLAVDVPSGVTQVTIAYQYDRAGGANVIDLGLLEPGPLDLGTRSFRGWSGGARSSVTVAASASTPGYRNGPIVAGRWHVILGLYKVSSSGVDVRVVVQMAGSGEAPGNISGQASGNVSGHGVGGSAAKVRWYAGALHAHTVHSDGALPPDRVVDVARRAGLDFVAITDHNNTTHTRDLSPSHDPLVLLGEEITTPGGHANALGLPDGAWIDFRLLPGEPGARSKIASLVDATHRAGALFVINHPSAECDACGWTHVVPEEVDAIEIWNGTRDNGPQPQAMAMWDRLLRAGKHVTAVGASDFHAEPSEIDRPTTWVEAARPSQETIVRAIKLGRAVVTRDARVPPPIVTVSAAGVAFAAGDTISHCGDSLRVKVDVKGIVAGRAELVWSGDRVAAVPVSDGMEFTHPCARGYARVHVLDTSGDTIAVTNPIYVNPSR